MFMLRLYPLIDCGSPDILMPAECPAFIGLKFGLIAEPGKPPRDAILSLHKWLELNLPWYFAATSRVAGPPTERLCPKP